MRRMIAGAALALVAGTAAASEWSAAVPLGLPPLPVPRDNPLSAAKIELGRKLFMDRRLSFNDTLSCGMCHVPEQGFTSNELATAIGIEGRTVRRNAPALYNVAYEQRLFVDGRESTLENQVWSPLLARNEMGNPSIGHVVDKIVGLKDYDGLFEKAFAGRDPGMETIGQAIASFERVLLSASSRFDRWYYKKESAALGAEGQAGFALFTGKAGCAACHTVGTEAAVFSDRRFHNTGVGYARSMGGPAKRKVRLAPGVFVEVDMGPIERVSEQPLGDVGRFEITNDPADRWAYKTPSLRNVALTAPYMHDGSLGTIEDVIEFYDRGGIDNPDKDPLLRPLALSAEEKRALAAFLRALTGDNWERLAKETRGGGAD